MSRFPQASLELGEVGWRISRSGTKRGERGPRPGANHWAAEGKERGAGPGQGIRGHPVEGRPTSELHLGALCRFVQPGEVWSCLGGKAGWEQEFLTWVLEGEQRQEGGHLVPGKSLPSSTPVPTSRFGAHGTVRGILRPPPRSLPR